MAENQEIRFEQEMRQSYLDYAMSVIVGRALPDVRDGLKPVHRRVLFSMHELNNGWNKSYKKSARIVGDVIGKYHPHGDSAVYDTIVRLAQPFSMRHPLVDGQGNFGSVDGDSPAAMRYTEVRMSKLSQELLQDIDKNTVDFAPNYDGSEKEPSVLPTRVPNLLVNGSTGIAVGMATNIPPHNLVEVIDATIAIIDNPSLSEKSNIEELIQISKLQGPDFPTFGEIKDNGGIRDALLNGRGSFKIRAKHVIEKKDNDKTSIVFTELPYQVNKARLIENIAQLVRDKKINEISQLRDESDKDGMRLVIEIKRGEQHEVVLGSLYKHTNAQISYSVNMVCLVDGEPKTLGFMEILNEFIKHRREVITRRTLYDLEKAKNKAHILEGLGVALLNVDEIIALIKKSKNTSEAKNSLMAKGWKPGQLVKFLGVVDKQTENFIPSDAQYGLDGKLYKLSPIQAQAILDLKLQKLTNLEQEKLFSDYSASAGLTNVHTGEYDIRIFKLLNISSHKNKFPLINKPNKIIGSLKSKIKIQIGIKQKIQVLEGLHDVSSAMLGAGCAIPNKLLLIGGTFSVAQMISTRPLLNENILCRTSYEINKWINIAFTPSGSNCIDWILKLTNQKIENLSTILEEVGEKRKNNIIFLPYLYGAQTGRRGLVNSKI